MTGSGMYYYPITLIKKLISNDRKNSNPRTGFQQRKPDLATPPLVMQFLRDRMSSRAYRILIDSVANDSQYHLDARNRRALYRAEYP